MKVTLITHTPDPEKVVATAARICYSQKADIQTIADGFTEDKIRKFIIQLRESSHTTPFEHVTFTFGIEGISRVLLAEISRHRIASLSVRSQRYCNEDIYNFVTPDSIAMVSGEAEEEFYTEAANAVGAYKDLLMMNIPKEDARYLLPGAMPTRMVLTMNARELLHFFSLRSCQRALPEMRKLSNAMIKLVKPVAPTLFEQAGPSCVQLGYCPEGTRCCGRVPTLNQLLDKYNERRG